MAVRRHIICKVDEIPEREGKSFKFDDVSVAVFKVGENLYALEDGCSHADVTISWGYVHKRELCVACPWHGAQFDLRSGKVMTPPACEDIKSFDVSIEGEDVVITS